MVYGISFDSPRTNARFAEKIDYPFELLSDKGRTAAVAFGAAKHGDAGFAARIAYVIGEDGNILFAYDTVDPATHLDQVLMDLRLKAPAAT